jgi:serine/threonine-protein kinase
VYALGVLTYWVFTHELPWPTRARRVDQVRDFRPLDGVPPGVADLLRRCLDPDPEARPAAADVALALNEVPRRAAVEHDIATWRAGRRAITAAEAQKAGQRRRRRLITAGWVGSAIGLLVLALAVVPSIGKPRDTSAAALTAPASVPNQRGPQATTTPSPDTSTTDAGARTPLAVPPDTSTRVHTSTVATAPAPPPVDEAVTADGGTIRVRCQGNFATLLSAQPAAGFDITKSDTKPTQIQVVFATATHQSDIRIRCGPQGIVPTVKETNLPAA